MEIWKNCYELTKSLPNEEKFGIISQVNRASASIPANIAEGSSRDSNKDYARFLQIALGSAFELETLLIGIKMLELKSKDEIDSVLSDIDEEQKMIMSFKKRISNS